MKKKVNVVFGTRPELIKLAPVIKELKRRDHAFETTVISTAQHREMLDQLLDSFGIAPHPAVIAKNAVREFRFLF